MKSLVVIAFAAIAIAAHAQSLVYSQPQVNDILITSELDQEFGNTVTFANGPATINDIDVTMRGYPSQSGASLTVEFFIRNLDGSGNPLSTPLWTGSEILTPTITSSPNGTGFDANISVPDISVPATEYIGVAITNVTNGTVGGFGLAMGGAPTIGSSNPDLMWADLQPYVSPFPVDNNITMNVYATPEPASLTALIGGAFLLRRRRRRES